ncbi:uncharacterized protein Eint_090710 [Encephalitozoon intestinalis ATCC 50506]|uniref:Uncharacterized protein n=1 Tax=Encephalitozoon intestinalis (strain ATCC 50506) TaxID=876142 RepID=E0S9D6_ENCIT|nr:uncharacterized protein Eint_090710 [Encephalitozoon intestinalis ATCC 50506]ADM12200.1 hypothetical protein Eint_090710 [Encephalitozoon intestinalis ATCC 50506]UTX46007.1 hypothetical protein GPK93_09g15930 [Encephalitozoon intestinalis]
MLPFDREERALIEREYVKHRKDIKKAKMRERHFKMKDKGYCLSIDLLGDSRDVVSMFLGYIEGLGISRRDVYEYIADAVLCGNNGISENLKRIVKLGIRDKNSIGKEIAKTCS